ncbi:hypothetical protein BV25DRAFT_1834778 [Artomyces pyxidatus]|uniref:Uncharacterized protein n=1 Tax=Artomyces pyxidatus TaxID=48021 RepID=A0ACB8TH64_9AGAM|nr:hypothetical protein BV25DRAFT_1834778 [Artomyces pyxidatus]
MPSAALDAYRQGEIDAFIATSPTCDPTQIIPGSTPNSYFVYLMRPGTFKLSLTSLEGSEGGTVHLTILNNPAAHPFRLPTSDDFSPLETPLPAPERPDTPSPSSSPVPTSEPGEEPLVMPTQMLSRPRDSEAATIAFLGERTKGTLHNSAAAEDAALRANSASPDGIEWGSSESFDWEGFMAAETLRIKEEEREIAMQSSSAQVAKAPAAKALSCREGPSQVLSREPSAEAARSTDHLAYTRGVQSKGSGRRVGAHLAKPRAVSERNAPGETVSERQSRAASRSL